MKKNPLPWFILLSALLPNLAPAAMRAEPVTLALDWKPEPEFGGFYAALSELSKMGIKLNIVPGGSGQPTVQMVSAGKVEFAIVSADELIVARGNGATPVALFAVYQDSPAGIMVHASSGIHSLAEVFTKGHTLAIQRGLPYANHLEKKYGFGKIKVVPYAGGISNFLADKEFAQQCFVTSEPLVVKKAGGDPETFLIKESGYNPYTTVVATSADYAKKHPDLVKRFVNAIRKGWESYLQDPRAVNAIMHQLNPAMDEATFAESAKAQKKLIQTSETTQSGVGSMTQKRWDELAAQLRELKVTKTKIDCSACVWKASN